METIGLIAAMQSESNALLQLIKCWKRFPIGPFRGARFVLLDREYHLVTTGMGLKRSMEATRSLVVKTRPSLLISFGIAGAVNSDLHIGDVVIARKACLLDDGLPSEFISLSSLHTAAWDAVAEEIRPDGAQLVSGTDITTHGSQTIFQELRKMPYPILEMETAGIAQVAAETGIPLISIRSVSDGPEAPIPFDLEAILDEKDNLRIGRVLMMVLHQPQLILQARRMRENSRKAADHAARGLFAALNQPTLLAV